MYYIKTNATFDSAHFLKDYAGKCANIHGHTWRVEVTAKSGGLITSGEKRGMVLDFSDLKKEVRKLTERFDHTLIFERGSLQPATLEALQSEGFSLTEFPARPTAENFAKYFYEALAETLPVDSVCVYENPQNSACYREE